MSASGTESDLEKCNGNHEVISPASLYGRIECICNRAPDNKGQKIDCSGEDFRSPDGKQLVGRAVGKPAEWFLRCDIVGCNKLFVWTVRESVENENTSPANTKKEDATVQNEEPIKVLRGKMCPGNDSECGAVICDDCINAAKNSEGRGSVFNQHTVWKRSGAECGNQEGRPVTPYEKRNNEN